jgi:hypothetical protein
MIVSELIKHLQTLPQNYLVMVRIPDPCGGPDYWVMSEKDVTAGDVATMDETGESDDVGKEYPAVLIGDDML